MNRSFLIYILAALLLVACRHKPSIPEIEYQEQEENTEYVEETPKYYEDEEEYDEDDEEEPVNSSSLEIPRLRTSKPEQILYRVGYTTSYNNETKNANWVAWHLTEEHTTGPWKRGGIPYMADDDVRGARQETSDWHGHSLPVNHGHMCPAGDNKWDEKAMEQSFLLTNMCPQNKELNSGDWEELESRCRGWAKHYGEVFIAAGPIFYNNDYKTIGDNEVGVPDAFFKVVLRMAKKPQALGFIYPNDDTHHKMDYYVLTVDEVEEQTGIDFFYNLPDDVEDDVESHSELRKW